MLCNACGVKALYSYRSRVQAVPKSKATKQQQGSKAPGPEKQPAQQDAWQSNKRRRVLSSDVDDLSVTSAQADFIKVERSHDPSGKRITTWTVTDCSIDDTRQFSQAMHGQAFIDECWLFISADNRWPFTTLAAYACCSGAACLACSMHATVACLIMRATIVNPLALLGLLFWLCDVANLVVLSFTSHALVMCACKHVGKQHKQP